MLVAQEQSLEHTPAGELGISRDPTRCFLVDSESACACRRQLDQLPSRTILTAMRPWSLITFTALLVAVCLCGEASTTTQEVDAPPARFDEVNQIVPEFIIIRYYSFLLVIIICYCNLLL